jgi:hypothetical protein
MEPPEHEPEYLDQKTQDTIWDLERDVRELEKKLDALEKVARRVAIQPWPPSKESHRELREHFGIPVQENIRWPTEPCNPEGSGGIPIQEENQNG